jgi:D-arabinose 1-dehydrogenase-like Zn-dependent alcohol dehydrogenase
MPLKMNAALVPEFGKPLAFRECDIPSPEPGQILVTTEACSVCHTIMAEALAFGTEGKVKADIELQPLSAINQVFNRLEHGDVASRVVLDFTRD